MKVEQFSITCSVFVVQFRSSLIHRISSSDGCECSLGHWWPWQGRCQWKNEHLPTEDEIRIREWALLQIKNFQMPVNKLHLKYQKLKSYCFVVLHLCSFTYSPSLLFLPLFKKIVPFFLCVSVNPVWEGTQSIKSSRRILDSSLMCFFKSCSSPRSFYLWRKGHVSTALAGFHRGCWQIPWLMHTGNKRHLFTFSPASWTFHGELPTKALAFPFLLAL